MPKEVFVFASSNISALDNNEFSEQLTDLINEYSGDYFGEIIIDVENNTISKDGEEKELEDFGVDYNSVDTVQPVVPAVAVLETMGMDAEYNEKTNEIEVDGESVSLIDDIVDDNDIVSSSDGFVKIQNDDNSYMEVPAAYMNKQQAEDKFNLEMSIDNGKIRITSPYQTMRLAVQTNSGELKRAYSAKKVVQRKDGYAVLQYDSIEKTATAYDKLKADSNVKFVNADRIKTVQSLVSKREGAQRIQSDRYIQYLKDNNKTTSVKIAVLDTGVDVNHELLKGRLVTGYNVYEKNSNVSDGHSHGTHCAGIIADNTPGNVKIMPVKVLKDNGSGTDLAIAQGIDWAVEHGAKIISMSLGGQTDNPRTDEMGKAVLRAYKKGVLVVCAAGNSTSETSNYSPAGISECVTVASCPADEYRISSFSNFGDEVDLAAPGENILSSVPDGEYDIKSGTSMACPFAAAGAALLYINNPKLTPAKIEAGLKETSADMLLTGWDKYSGYGYLNFGIMLGDSVLPENFGVSPKEIELTAFSKAAGYLFEALSSGKNNNVVLTNAAYDVVSDNESVAIFDGRHIVPKSAGETTITATTANGLTASSKVKCVKKEVWIDYASKSYAGGKGTKSSPYLISTPQQLAKLSLDTRNGVSTKGKYYKLTKDIDLAGKDFHSITYVYDAGDFLGSRSYTQEPFEGNFDGNNHKILNMTVFADEIKAAWFDSTPYNEKWYTFNCGLFADILGAHIKNLGIENAYVSNDRAGILFADSFGEYNKNTLVENVYTSGFSAGFGMFFGIWNSNVTVKNCYSSANTLSGGFCNMVYASNNFDGNNVLNCFFCGDIIGADYNYANSGFVDNIESNEEEFHSARLYNCFSAATPKSSIGFAYSNINGALKKCYFNKANKYGIKNQNSKYGNASGKADSFFKSKSNFTNASYWYQDYKWDFNNIWAIDSTTNSGYPYLKNIKPAKLAEPLTNTWIDYASDSFAGGDGTKESPYLIQNAEQLSRIAKRYRYGGGKDTYFSIENDIDLSAHEWYKIGGGRFNNSHDGDRYPNRIFRGHIDGNSHTISNLTITDGGDYAGFISILDRGSVKNLNFENVNINGDDFCGSVCGLVRSNSTVANCNISGTVSGKTAYAGGICGCLCGTSKLVLCNCTVAVDAEKSGGITGKSEGGLVERCSYKKNGPTKYAFTMYNFGEFLNCLTDMKSADATKSNNALFNKCICSDYMYEYSKRNKGRSYRIKTPLKTSDYPAFDFENVWEIKNGAFALRESQYTETVNRPTTYWSENCATSFAGGNGKRTNPFLVSTPEQFAYMLKFIDDNLVKNYSFKITNDIDMGAHLYDSEIYYYSIVAFAYIDGDCHTVSNIYFTDNSMGVFPYSIGGEIRNFNFENLYGYSCSGVALDVYNTGLVSDCHVKNAHLTTVTDEDGTLSIFATGGIAADNFGTIERCSFDGELCGYYNVAPIAGNNNGKVRNCYSSGRISGYGSGLIVDNNSHGTVSNCYSIAECINSNEITNINFTDCYSAFKYSSTNFGKQTYTQLKQKSTYTDWDFDNVWDINSEVNDGYPTIRPQPYRSISYVLNGGTLSSSPPAKYRAYSPIALPTPKRESYSFDGWYADSDFDTKALSEIGYKDSGDVTLYAKWSLIYNVKFNANGGKGSMSNQKIKYNSSTALKKNAFERTGYTFQGWSKTKNGSVVYKNAQKVKNITTAGKTITLYAVWKANTYNIKFYNGLTGKKKKTVTQKGFTYGKSKNLRKNTFKLGNSSYVFGGWSCFIDGKRRMFADGESVKNLTSKNGKTFTFEAYWVPDSTYTIKYNLNGGTIPKGAKTKIRAGRGYYKLPTPTKKGYTFAGWYTNKGCTKGKTTKIPPWIENNVKLYAKWKKK